MTDAPDGCPNCGMDGCPGCGPFAESRKRAKLVEQVHASAELIREARGDGTRPQVVVTEERWHSLANALDALVGLLAPGQADAPETPE